MVFGCPLEHEIHAVTEQVKPKNGSNTRHSPFCRRGISRVSSRLLRFFFLSWQSQGQPKKMLSEALGGEHLNLQLFTSECFRYLHWQYESLWRSTSWNERCSPPRSAGGKQSLNQKPKLIQHVILLWPACRGMCPNPKTHSSNY